MRINGGYFVFKRDIFRYIHDGEELVVEPFQTFDSRKTVNSYPYDGFFASLDTFRDKQQLDDFNARGNAPWEVWKSGPAQGPSAGSSESRTGAAKSAAPVGRQLSFTQDTDFATGAWSWIEALRTCSWREDFRDLNRRRVEIPNGKRSIRRGMAD